MSKVEEQKTEDPKIIKSACHMCHGGCGTLVHVKEGKVVKITGDPESPLSKGKLCAKGMASIEHLYHPNRLKYPRKRAGKGGEGKWERISWDDALALGMMNVMISESLYDKEFVEKWTVGFDHLKERVAEYPLERVEKITWVPAEKIQAAARLFAKASPATLEWGVALEHTPNCLQTVRAIGMLPAITGNIDIPGGFVFGMPGGFPKKRGRSTGYGNRMPKDLDA